MCRTSNYTNSEEIEAAKKEETQTITDVYIGVFFDGTNNNMNRVYMSDVASISPKYKNIAVTKNNNEIFKSLFCFVKFFGESQNVSDFIQHRKDEKKRETEENQKLRRELNEELATSNSYKLRELKNNNNDNVYSQNSLSNIAFLTSLYQGIGKTGNHKMLNVYMEGAGATTFLDDGEMNIAGLALGIGVTGCVSIVSRAMLFIYNFLESLSVDNNSVKLHFDVFGFSRGATCARMFSCMVNEDSNSMTRGKEFCLYLQNTKLMQQDGKVIFLEKYKHKTVDFLGLFDTVTSIGMLEIPSTDNSFHPKFVESREGYMVNKLYNKLKGKEVYVDKNRQDIEIKSAYFGVLKYTQMEILGNFHRDNVKSYGLYISEKVKHTLHIGAIDEYRENFAFTNIGSKVPKNAVEVMIPGCHSDIGGGYVGKQSNLVTIALGKKISKIKEEDIENNDITKISYSYPGEDGKYKKLSIEELKKIGWIKSIEGEGCNIVSNSLTGEYVDKEPKDYDKIQFNNVDINGGYSNIPLSMMVNYVEAKLKERQGVFEPLFHKRVEIPDRIDTDMVKKLQEECSEGNRYYFCPGDFASSDYQSLRQEFLHFTATDELNLGLTNQNWSNLLGANAPYRKNGLLGRLMYMGGKDDGNGMYFMNSSDCKFTKINVEIKINNRSIV